MRLDVPTRDPHVASSQDKTRSLNLVALAGDREVSPLPARA